MFLYHFVVELSLNFMDHLVVFSHLLSSRHYKVAALHLSIDSFELVLLDYFVEFDHFSNFMLEFHLFISHNFQLVRLHLLFHKSFLGFIQVVILIELSFFHFENFIFSLFSLVFSFAFI